MIKDRNKNWKVRTFGTGVGLGLLLGLIAAYVYVNSNEERMRVTGERSNVSAGDMMTLALSGIAFVRQVAELGNTPKNGKKR